MENQNQAILKDIIEATRNQTSVSGAPNAISNTIVPTFEINPFASRTTIVSRTNTNTATGAYLIYTTPADKDFYLTNACLGVIKDAACDTASGSIYISFQEGDTGANTGALCGIPILTLTAQQLTASTDLKNPIKISRGTNISMGGSVAFTAGSRVMTGTISGFFGSFPSTS